MNNDLISRSELKKNLDLKFSFGLENKIKLFDEIDNTPTAYDADKIIEQLEERRANHDCKICKYYVDGNITCEHDCADALIDDLIEIVKAGVKNG